MKNKKNEYGPCVAASLSTYTATIFIAGDIAKIKDACRKFCLSGMCVTITRTDFVFTGGSETGTAIGLINYPRFPSDATSIRLKARELAHYLMSECCQRTCSVVGSDVTELLTNPDIKIPR